MTIAIAAVTLALAVPAVAASAALEAEQRAAGAADSAALAAADALLGFVRAEPCSLAADVVHSFEAVLLECQLDWEHSQVRVVVGVQTIFGTVHSRARAGPPVA